jgi:hypothetical protein
MAIDFPSTPTVGQQYIYNGITYVFSAQGVWTITGASFAPIDSPTFTVNPTAPTPSPGDNDTSIATTAFVAAATAGGAAWTTGDVKLTYKGVADPGWILLNEGSIGNASSGATTRANADTVALFTLMWSYSSLSMQDSAGTVVARGANAAADYAFNRRLVLPLSLGRHLAMGGNGAGLQSHPIATWVGAESYTQTEATMAGHSHATVGGDVGPSGMDSTLVVYGVQSNGSYWSTATDVHGSSQAFSIMNPATYMNVMVKL